MAITESLPVGNEVAGGATSKTPAGVDAGVFAQSFAAAGGAGKPRTAGSGTPGSGVATAEGSGLVVPAKGQQDLAGWGTGREFEGQDGAAAGETGSVDDAGQGSGAVSSLIGQHEVVELPRGAVPSLALDQTVSGVGTKQVALTPEIVGSAATPSLDGMAGSGEPVGNALASRLVDALPVRGSATSVTGDQAVKVAEDSASAPVKLTAPAVLQGGASVKSGVGNSGFAISPGSKLLQPVAVTASASPSVVAERVGQADALTAGTDDLGAGQPVTAGAVQDAAGLGKTGSLESEPVHVASVRDESGVGKPSGEAARNQQVGGDGLGTARGAAPLATAHGRDAAKTEGGVAGPRRRTSSDDKTVDLAGMGSGSTHGTMPATGSTLEPTAGKATEMAALSVTTPTTIRPASEARPLVFEEIGSVTAVGQDQGVDAAVARVQALADGASAKVAGRQGVAPGLVGAGGAVDGLGRLGSGGLTVSSTGTSGAVTGATGRLAKGSLPKPVSESGVPVAAASSAGDGSSVLPVGAATTVAPPLTTVSSAESEAGLGAVSAMASRGVADAGGAKPGVVGTAVAKDKDRKTSVDGTRNEAPAGTMQGVRPGGDEKVAAGGIQEAATASSTGKAETAHGKSFDAGHVSGEAGGAGVGAVGTTGTVSGNGHGSAAGLSGGLAATLSAAPVRAEVVSAASGSAARGAGSAEDGGLAGLSSGAAGSGQGHTTLQATPTVLEVGVPGGTHGWLKIRAELGEGGAVQASVSSGTQAGQETLRRELPAMSAYLQSEHVPVTLQMAHGVATAAGSAAGGLAGDDGLSSGLGAGGGGQTGANADQSRSEAGGFAGASAGGADAGELGRERTQSSDTGMAGAVSGASSPDGVSAAVTSAESEWARPLGYGGVSVGGGGSWVNVIA